MHVFGKILICIGCYALFWFSGWEFVKIYMDTGKQLLSLMNSGGDGIFTNDLICITVDNYCYGVRNLHRFFQSPVLSWMGLGASAAIFLKAIYDLQNRKSE